MASSPAQPVVPSFLDPQTLAAMTSIDLRARVIVEGLLAGVHRSPQQGISVEFAQHRAYTPGDDTRFLDWNIFGKTDKLYLKQYQQETNLDLLLLVDCSASMGYTSLSQQPAGWTNHWSKWNHGACIAAAMANLALRQQDRVGLTLFADTIVAGSRLSNAQHHWKEIAQLLHQTQLVGEAEGTPEGTPERTPEVGANRGGGPTLDQRGLPGGLSGGGTSGGGRTDLGAVVERVVGNLTRRSLVVLISDLFDDPAHLASALARLHHRHHDVLILQVMDPAELDFDFRDASDFRGLEGEGMLPVDPPALRKAYQQVVADHLDAVRRAARQFHYDYLLLNTREALGPPLSKFLARRAAMLAKR